MGNAMGIFDDEVNKMTSEAAEQTRSAVQREDELNKVARSVSTDLLSFIASRPAAAGSVDVSVYQNQITVHGRAPRRTFVVFCEGPEAFRVKETTGVQTGPREPSKYSDRDVITRSEMVRWVIERLKELQAA